MTKLMTPAPGEDLVARPRLTDRLRPEGRRLTLLSAPAGSGKTTLLAEWIHHDHPSVAWVSLDRQDNTPRRFLAHVLAACTKARPALAEALSPRQGAESTSPPFDGVSLESLVNGLAGLDEPFTLVLDDYHFIEEPLVHRVVEFLVEHQPPCLHLVVSSRHDPPLPLSQLRVRRRLQEIRGSDLRFTSGEAAEMLASMLGLPLPQEEVATLCSRTEGWAAGLQLAALSLRSVEDHQSLIAGFHGDHHHVVDYLTDEVLEGLEEGLRGFMLRTSILDRLTAPLCEMLTGCGGAQDRLELLEKANLFLVPLDQQRKWYRYHHLFGELLRSRLASHFEPSEVARFHLAAASWHIAHDLPDPAIEHALAATSAGAEPATRNEALDLLVELVEGHGHRIFTRARRFEVEAWLDRLPEERKLERPKLALLTAKVLVINQRRSEAERYLAAATTALDELATDEPWSMALRGEMLVTRASLALRHWQFEAVVRDLETALLLLPPDDLANHAHAALLLGLARRCLAAHEPAWQALRQAADLGRRSGDPLIVVSAWTALGRLRLSQGRLGEAEALCRQVIALCVEKGWDQLAFMVIPRANLGEILWERGDRAARAELEQALSVVARNPAPRSEIRREGREIAEVLLRLLDWSSSAGIGSAPQTVPPESRLLPLLDPLPLLQAREGLLRGDVAAVRRWLDGEGVGPDDPLTPWGHPVHLLLARVLLAEGRPERSLALLGRLGVAVEKAGQTRLAIEVHAVQALARQQQGATGKALEALRRALGLASPEGAARVFLELGAPLVPLLKPLATEYPDLVERVSGAVPMPEEVSEARLLEPLSERERQVLELLYGGLSNKEIAQRLFVSANTVKTHIRNLYAKIGVGTRGQAIARIRELGLL